MQRSSSSLIAGSILIGLGVLFLLQTLDIARFHLTWPVILIVIGVLWLLIDRLLLAPLERATIERWGLVRGA